MSLSVSYWMVVCMSSCGAAAFMWLKGSSCCKMTAEECRLLWGILTAGSRCVPPACGGQYCTYILQQMGWPVIHSWLARDLGWAGGSHCLSLHRNLSMALEPKLAPCGWPCPIGAPLLTRPFGNWYLSHWILYWIMQASAGLHYIWHRQTY